MRVPPHENKDIGRDERINLEAILVTTVKRTADDDIEGHLSFAMIDAATRRAATRKLFKNCVVHSMRTSVNRSYEQALDARLRTAKHFEGSR